MVYPTLRMYPKYIGNKKKSSIKHKRHNINQKVMMIHIENSYLYDIRYAIKMTKLKKATAPGIPRRSPIQVLTRPYVA